MTPDTDPRIPASTGSSSLDVVAIDGPSGSGKSTVARRLAERLGYAYLDTGAMYRAVTWGLLENQFRDLDDAERLGALLGAMRITFGAENSVQLNGRDVTAHLRSAEVESQVSAVSAVPLVRDHMRTLQRATAEQGPLVAEGRDMASVVFPGARWKFYLDAEPEERARRRHAEFVARGRSVSEGEVLDEMAVRDRLDSTRRDAPLSRSSEATYIDTTAQSIDQVVDRMLSAIGSSAEEGR